MSNAYNSPIEHLADELRAVDILAGAVIAAEGSDKAPTSGRDLGLGPYITPDEARDCLHGKQSADQVAASKTQLQKLRTSIEARVAATANTIELPIQRFRALFALDQFEWMIVLICVAPYFDDRYQKLYAYLHNDVAETRASLGLVYRLLCGSLEERAGVRLFLANHFAVRDWQILERSERGDRLYVSTSIVDALIANDRPEAGLAHFFSDAESQASAISLDAAIINKLEHLLAALHDEATSGPYIIALCGQPGSGRLAAAQALSRSLGRPVFTLRLSALLGDRARSFEESLRLVLRECLMHGATLYIPDFADAFSAKPASPGDVPVEPGQRSNALRDHFLRELARSSALTILACEEPPRLREEPGAHYPVIEFPLPDAPARTELWRQALATLAPERVADELITPEELAAMYRFTPGQIHDALRSARDLALANRADGIVTTDDLIAGCRAQCSRKLGELASPIKTSSEWDDLVLPEEQLADLKSIYIYFRQRDRVFDEWEFRRRVGSGRGYHALFAGPPGTGKTMAAGIIAERLRLEIFKIDLAGIVSKYIGETEKNLAAIFREAEASQAILFFDEADSLFGKRTAVQDSHDRYANIETSYLLQRMEAYDGITILATNLLQNIDEAFLRRLHVVIDFPFPDLAGRRRIWENIFPRETPLSADLDLDFLADRARIAGGNIKNIALSAAIHAAEADTAVGMQHIVQAARAEYRKIGKPFVDREFAR